MLARHLQRWSQTTQGKSNCNQWQAMSNRYIVEGLGSLLVGLAIPTKQAAYNLQHVWFSSKKHLMNNRY